MSDRFENVSREFKSLQDCVEFLQQQCEEGEWLFRGERTDRFLTSPPILERVRNDRKLPPRCRAAIESRVQQLHQDLQRFLDIGADLAMGFLQHYEAPTDLLDLTSDLLVAASFASDGEVGADGLIGVIPKDEKIRPELVDLRYHPKALRPRIQQAFTFRSNTFGDPKSEACIQELGIRWYRFTRTETDKSYSNPALLDAHMDPVAGVIQLLLDSYGKTNDWTADWLATHVVAAPFITQITGQDSDGAVVVELVSTTGAGMTFDDAVERFNNRRIWSNQYPDVRGSGGLQNLRFA